LFYLNLRSTTVYPNKIVEYPIRLERGVLIVFQGYLGDAKLQADPSPLEKRFRNCPPEFDLAMVPSIGRQHQTGLPRKRLLSSSPTPWRSSEAEFFLIVNICGRKQPGTVRLRATCGKPRIAFRPRPLIPESAWLVSEEWRFLILLEIPGLYRGSTKWRPGFSWAFFKSVVFWFRKKQLCYRVHRD